MSLATLSEKEIQQRVQLGLVTTPPQQYQEQPDDDEEEDLEEWEDFDTDEEDAKDDSNRSGDDDYRIAATRRSSVDLATLHANLHDSNSWEQAVEDADAPNKRLRNSSISDPLIYGSIAEDPSENDDEEVATVNGDDDHEMAGS